MQKIKITAGDKVALEATKLLIENVEAMLSLQELSRKSGINLNKLKQGFKLIYGIPPYTYHHQLKMEKAKKLLRETDQPVSEIAWQSGYQQASGFCKSFKKFAGVSALEWRSGPASKK